MKFEMDVVRGGERLSCRSKHPGRKMGCIEDVICDTAVIRPICTGTIGYNVHHMRCRNYSYTAYFGCDVETGIEGGQVRRKKK
jgi:hypothetical protein